MSQISSWVVDGSYSEITSCVTAFWLGESLDLAPDRCHVHAEIKGRLSSSKSATSGDTKGVRCSASDPRRPPRRHEGMHSLEAALAEDRAEQLKREPEKVAQELERRLRADLGKKDDFHRIHPRRARWSQPVVLGPGVLRLRRQLRRSHEPLSRTPLRRSRPCLRRQPGRPARAARGRTKAARSRGRGSSERHRAHGRSKT